MTNRKRLAAVCLALMGLGFVGEGAAMAAAGGVPGRGEPPPQPSSPPGREQSEGQDEERRPAHAADPQTGSGNQFKNR